MAKTISLVFGAIFVLVGLLGFVNDPVLGIFEVDTLHNIVHLVTGLILGGVGLMGEAKAKKGAQVFGVVYAIVAILGLLLPGEMLLGLIEVNTADDLLHLVVAAILLYVGFAEENGGQAASTPPPSAPSESPPPAPPAA